MVSKNLLKYIIIAGMDDIMNNCYISIFIYTHIVFNTQAKQEI